MLKSFYYLLIPSFFLFACDDKNDGPAKVSAVVADIKMYPAVYGTADQSDVWFIVTNTKDEVLTVNHWDKSETVQLKGDLAADEKVNLFIFYAQQSSYYLDAYMEVDRGRQWQIGKMQSLGTQNGQAYVTFNHVPTKTFAPLVYGFQPGVLSVTPFKTEYHSGMTATATGSTGPDPDYNYWNTTGLFFQHAETDLNFFSYLNGTMTPMYFQTDTINSFQPLLYYTYDFEEVFTPFDHTVTLEGASNHYTNLFVGAVNGSEKFPQAINQAGGQAVAFGYNDGFDKYFVKVSNSADTRFYTWEVLTTTPSASQFDFPDADFTVTETAFNNFQSTIQWDKNFESRTSSWSVEWPSNGLMVRVHTDKLTGKVIDKLPNEILTAYPIVGEKWNQLAYGSSKFVFNDDGRTYAEAIDKAFSEDQIPVWRTSYSIEK